MAIQIANPIVVDKIERFAALSGLSKTAAVEMALDAMLAGKRSDDMDDVRARLDAMLAQLDRIPDLPQGYDPLEWDELGLPR